MRMKSILCLTCLLYLVNAAGDETSRKVSSDCYYFSKFDSFFFQINIGGISQNISCLQNCWCNGTDTGYSSLNCQACCCQKRIMDKKEVLPDCKKYVTWGIIATILLVMIPLIVSVKVLRIMRRNNRKIRELQKELANKEYELQQHMSNRNNFIMQNNLPEHQNNQEQEGG